MGAGPARSIFTSVQVVALFILLTLHPASGITEIGELIEVGNMVTARYNHTAELLSDGRVLVCGNSVAIAATIDHNVPGWHWKIVQSPMAGN